MTLPQPARNPVQATVGILLCAAAAGAAAVPYHGFFGDWRFAAPTLAAVVAGVAGAAVPGLRNWRAASTVLTGVLTFAVVAPVLAGGSPAAYLAPVESFADAGSGLIHGSGRMFTVNVPADLTADTLMVPGLLAWLSGFVGVTVLLRTRGPVAPIVPALVCFGFALAAVAGAGTTNMAAAAVLGSVTLLLIVVRANVVKPTTERPSSARIAWSYRGAAAMLVAATAVATVAAGSQTWVRGDNRADPRTFVPQYVAVPEQITPLTLVKNESLTQPPRRLFTVHGRSGDLSGQFIRTAALDAFDGSLWTTNDRYLVAGRRLAKHSAPAGGLVTIRVEVDGLDGPFLPSIGRPVSISPGLNPSQVLGFNNDSGVLVSGSPVLRGLRYDLTAQVIRRGPDLAKAKPTRTRAFAHLRSLPPGPPDAAVAITQDVATSATTAYRQLELLEGTLRAIPFNQRARAGHSYAAIERLLADGASGSAEQHAAAFAVLARILGYPARVAVGYRLPDPAGVMIVDTSQAEAWVEVHFDGVGWVPFDPTDESLVATDQEASPDAGVAPTPVQPPTQPDEAQSPPATQTGTGDEGGVATQPPASLRWLPWLVAAAGLLIVAAPTTVIGLKARQRRRRRRAVAASAQVLGAWREAVDRCTEQGLIRQPWATAYEAARRAVDVLGTRADPLRELAVLATAAAYSGRQPADADIRAAWRLENRLRRHLCQGRARPLRHLRCRIDPRPLLNRPDAPARGRSVAARSGTADKRVRS